MSPASSIERLVEKIKENQDIEEVTLVSRSGMHIAGEVPKDAHRETFVAMSAILLGAAETATSELQEELSYVLVVLEGSKIILHDGGPNSIISLKISDEGEVEKILESIEQPLKELRENL